MKHYLLTLMCSVLFISGYAQELITQYDFKPIIDSLSLDMKTKDEFEFVSNGKHGYINLNSPIGVIIPPKFSSIEKMKLESVIKSDLYHHVKFFKVKLGKYYGVYRYYNEDTVIMLPCKYERIRYVLYKGNYKLVTSLNGKSDTFDAMRSLQESRTTDDEDAPFNGFSGSQMHDPDNLKETKAYRIDRKTKSSQAVAKVISDTDAMQRKIINTPFKIIKHIDSANRITMEVFNDSEKISVFDCHYEKIRYLPKNRQFLAYNDKKAELFDVNGKSMEIVEGDFKDFYQKECFIAYSVQMNQYKYGLVDKNLNWLVSPFYENAKALIENKTYRFFNGQKFLIYEVRSNTFRKAEIDRFCTQFDFRYGLVKVNYELCLMDTRSDEMEVIHGYKFNQAMDSFALVFNDTAFLLLNLNNGSKTKIKAEKIEFLNLKKYPESFGTSYSKLLLIVKSKGKFGVIDEKNDTIVPLIFDSLVLSLNPIAKQTPIFILKKDGLYHLFSIVGEKMFLDSLSEVYYEFKINKITKLTLPEVLVRNSVYIVKRNGKYCRVKNTATSKLIWRDIDNLIKCDKYNWVFKAGNKYGIWRTENDKIIDGYDSIRLNIKKENSLHLFYKNGLCYPFTVDGFKPYNMLNISRIQSHCFTLENYYRNGISYSERNYSKICLYSTEFKGKKGIIFSDTSYTYLIFDEIYFSQENYLIWVKINGKWGYYNCLN